MLHALIACMLANQAQPQMQAANRLHDKVKYFESSHLLPMNLKQDSDEPWKPIHNQGFYIMGKTSASN